MANTYIFSDIDMTMGLNIRGDIAKVTDVNSIKQSVRNIVLTRDHLFSPEDGPRISGALFDLDNPFNRALLQDEIKLALKRKEKRVNDVRVEFGGSIDENEMICTITFQIVGIVGRYSVDVVLQKVR